MHTLTILFLFIVTLFFYVYSRLKKSRRYFRDAGIPYIEPHWLFGNLKDAVLMRSSFIVELQKLYEQFEPHRFAGIYNLFNRIIIIRDPEIIKRMLIKDFSYFQDHGLPASKNVEPMANNLFNLEGDEWKNLRIKLTGTFTSGRMKIMFPLLKKCAEDIKPVLMKYVDTPEGLEIRDLCARFTTDVIGSCAFGIDTHSLQDPKSEFRQMGKRIFEFRWQGVVRIVVPKLPDWCIKYFGLHTFDTKISDYFLKCVKDMVKYREENNITRGDFLDILIGLKNHKEMEKLKDHHEDADLAKFMSQISDKCIKSDVEMTIELMAAQCFIFFVGGFEGTSAALTFLLFELAQNPHIQEKVREEIISTIESNGGEMTYDLLNKLPYTFMVLQETIRKYDLNGSILIRKCGENYKIPDSDIIIEKGTSVFIPMNGIHHDKKYYEKPNEFYPEHFTKEAISQRHHFAYLPFGEGPRVCIAERFAKMQILMGAIYMIKDFIFELSPKTKLPLRFLPTSFGILPVEGGVWLKCRPYKA